MSSKQDKIPGTPGEREALRLNVQAAGELWDAPLDDVQADAIAVAVLSAGFRRRPREETIGRYFGTAFAAALIVAFTAALITLGVAAVVWVVGLL